MLKHMLGRRNKQLYPQPPSGGCVLKRKCGFAPIPPPNPAAFGRLCVETYPISGYFHNNPNQPPSGGCVLKQRFLEFLIRLNVASRLRAAVC